MHSAQQWKNGNYNVPRLSDTSVRLFKVDEFEIQCCLIQFYKNFQLYQNS